jgi:hypothetical protein
MSDSSAVKPVFSDGVVSDLKKTMVWRENEHAVLSRPYSAKTNPRAERLRRRALHKQERSARDKGRKKLRRPT